RAGWRSASSSNRCFTEVAARSKFAAPPVSCTRLPTSTTRAMDQGSVLGGASVGALAALAVGRALVEPLGLQPLEDLRGRHRKLGEADAGGLLDGIGD